MSRPPEILATPQSTVKRVKVKIVKFRVNQNSRFHYSAALFNQRRAKNKTRETLRTGIFRVRQINQSTALVVHDNVHAMQGIAGKLAKGHVVRRGRRITAHPIQRV